MPGRPHPVPVRDEPDADANRRTASLAALAVTLIIVVVGVFLLRALEATSAVEDCLLAGRRNCDSLLTTAPQAPARAP